MPYDGRGMNNMVNGAESLWRSTKAVRVNFRQRYQEENAHTFEQEYEEDSIFQVDYSDCMSVREENLTANHLAGLVYSAILNL